MSRRGLQNVCTAHHWEAAVDNLLTLDRYLAGYLGLYFYQYNGSLPVTKGWGCRQMMAPFVNNMECINLFVQSFTYTCNFITVFIHRLEKASLSSLLWRSISRLYLGGAPADEQSFIYHFILNTPIKLRSLWTTLFYCSALLAHYCTALTAVLTSASRPWKLTLAVFISNTELHAL